jgi:hypothetical protein
VEIITLVAEPETLKVSKILLLSIFSSPSFSSSIILELLRKDNFLPAKQDFLLTSQTVLRKDFTTFKEIPL